MRCKNPSIPRGVQSIAAFEAFKGLAVLLVGFGLLRLMPEDLQGVGEKLVAHLHLNPAHHLPRVFLQAWDEVTPSNVRWLAVGALMYSLLRFTEAYGLFRGRWWATWIAVLSTMIYLPIEVEHLVQEFSWVTLMVTGLNFLLVLYLIRTRKKAKKAES